MINKQVVFVVMRFLSLNRIYAVKFRYVVPDSTVCQGGHQEMVLGEHTHTQHMCITMGTSQSLEAKGKLVPRRKSYCVSFFFFILFSKKHLPAVQEAAPFLPPLAAAKQGIREGQKTVRNSIFTCTPFSWPEMAAHTLHFFTSNQVAIHKQRL